LNPTQDTQNTNCNQKELISFKNDNFFNLINSYLPETEDIQNYVENSLMQPNEISRAGYEMTLTELKTFSYLIKTFRIENRDYKNRSFTFNLKEILNDLSIDKSGTGKNSYIETVKNMLDIKIYIENDKIFEGINIFERTKFEKETGMVYFSFTEPFAKILERKDGGKFTLLNFEEMINLDSIYSIRFYQFSMSFKGFKGKFRKPDDAWFKENIKNSKNTWLYGYSLEQLKFLLGISEKYNGNNKTFLTKVIEKPFKELSEKVTDFDFKYQIIRKNNKSNGKIEGFLFWTEEKNSKPEETKSLKNKKQPKLLLNDNFNYESYGLEQKLKIISNQENDLKPLNDLQEKYPEEFEKRFQKEKAKNPPFAMELVLRKNVFDSMIADGFEI